MHLSLFSHNFKIVMAEFVEHLLTLNNVKALS